MPTGPSPPAPALDQKNSPSRFPFRPPLSMTFPLRVLPSNSASTYSGSVLGARGNLWRWTGPLQGSRNTPRPQFAEIQLSTYPQQGVQLVDNPSPSPERVKSARAAPSSAGDVTRGRVLHLGARLRPLHLARRPRRRRERRDGLRLRRRRRLPDLHLRDGLRHRRAAASASAARGPRALIPGQSEEQQPSQLGPHLVAKPFEHRPAQPGLRELGTVREQKVHALRSVAVEGGAHSPSIGSRASRFIPPRRDGRSGSAVSASCAGPQERRPPTGSGSRAGSASPSVGSGGGGGERLLRRESRLRAGAGRTGRTPRGRTCRR